MKPQTLRMVRIIAGIVLISLCLLFLDGGAQALPVESEQQEVQLNYQEQSRNWRLRCFLDDSSDNIGTVFCPDPAWGNVRIFGQETCAAACRQGIWRVLDEISLGPNHE